MVNTSVASAAAQSTEIRVMAMSNGSAAGADNSCGDGHNNDDLECQTNYSSHSFEFVGIDEALRSSRHDKKRRKRILKRRRRQKKEKQNRKQGMNKNKNKNKGDDDGNKNGDSDSASKQSSLRCPSFAFDDGTMSDISHTVNKKNNRDDNSDAFSSSSEESSLESSLESSDEESSMIVTLEDDVDSRNYDHDLEHGYNDIDIESKSGLLSSDSDDFDIFNSDNIFDADNDNQSLTSMFFSTNRRKIASKPFLRKLRAILMVLFVYISLAVPLTIFALSRRQQVIQMERTFESLSTTAITEAIRKDWQIKLQTLTHLSTMATSHAHTTNETFPFVSLWDFHLHAQSAITLSNAVSIGMIVKLSNKQRVIWEQDYVSNNQQWLHQAQQQSQAISKTPIPQFSFQIHTLSEQDVNHCEQDHHHLQQPRPYNLDMYMPSWQIMPPNTDFINFDFLSYDVTQRAIQTVLNTSKPVMSDIEQASSENDLSSRFYCDFKHANYDKHDGHVADENTNVADDGHSQEVAGAITDPISHLFVPIFDKFDQEGIIHNNIIKTVVGVMYAAIDWKTFFHKDVIPSNSQPIMFVIENGCGTIFSFVANGNNATFLGYNDYHNNDFDYIEQSLDFPQPGNCPYKVRAYPTIEFQRFFVNSKPLYSTMIAASIFLFLYMVIASYDCVLQKRIEQIVQDAKKDRAIVASLFPQQVRQNLVVNTNNKNKKKKKNNNSNNNSSGQSDIPHGSSHPASINGGSRHSVSRRGSGHASIASSVFHPKTHIQSYLRNSLQQEDLQLDFDEFEDDENEEVVLFAKPIADLFLHCTVLFANISGFSAWSSEREPQQVFLLLETVFQAMDGIAKRRQVFKVETIGDSYVAVTGLPDPQPDHALRMTRFARDCIIRVNKLMNMLEVKLGPDTGNLKLRIGMNSGPVTAGVLRGEKSRFQLFGDTVNTAARMESTGLQNRIQISASTADLLKQERGVAHWVQPRSDTINVKGKGVVQTFWILHGAADDGSVRSALTATDSERSEDVIADEEDNSATGFADRKDLWEDDERGAFTLPPTSRIAKNKRLVEWLVGSFSDRLKLIIAQRQSNNHIATSELSDKNPNDLIIRGETLLDEMVEAFTLPKFNPKGQTSQVTPESVELDDKVTDQLRNYIAAIADKYRENPFHNFEHASHVTMSVMKLLHRIVEADEVDYQTASMDAINSFKHNYTYGITSDALAQFAVAFSALIHDVDHTGVPNGQLAKENPELGEKYKNRAIAEQNSVDIAWDLLMKPEYKELQECIFTTEKELKRFRALVVNLVVATDIFDKDLKSLRNNRWDKAFKCSSDQSCGDQNEAESTATPTSFYSTNSDSNADSVETNLKATIVLEHIVQASDVSHTMQHWNVYKKWNERLFHEMYAAWETKRAGKDPSEGWYKGELWFFDNYVIPLAKKLEECCVFGVSSDECLNYALENRKEWAMKGEAIIEDVKERYHKRKALDIGGFTPEEITLFDKREVQYILDLLIKRGRAFGSFKGTDKNGQRSAAQSWLDALEIYERAPAASELSDKTMIFPIFSGILAFLKGGSILQDAKCTFEWNLAELFVKQTEKLGDPVHFTRAMGMLCEVQARSGNPEAALETFDVLSDLYEARLHTEGICKSYGTDRAAHAYSQQALWHDQLGNEEKGMEACEFVLDKLLPHMDPANILNSFELLYPIFRYLVPRGQAKEMSELLDHQIIQSFIKHEITFTPCRPLFKPLKTLFDIMADPDRYTGYKDAIEWFLVEGNCLVNAFLDQYFLKLGWSPNTITADICLRIAKKLLDKNCSDNLFLAVEEYSEGNMEDEGNNNNKQTQQQPLDRITIAHKLLANGLLAARNADWKMKDTEGIVLAPIPYKIHLPILTELEEMTKSLDIEVAEVTSQLTLPEVPLKTRLGLVWIQ